MEPSRFFSLPFNIYWRWSRYVSTWMIFFILCTTVFLSLQLFHSHFYLDIYVFFNECVWVFKANCLHHNHIQWSKWYAVSFLLLGQLLHTEPSAYTLSEEKRVNVFHLMFCYGFFPSSVQSLSHFVFISFFRFVTRKKTQNFCSTWVRKRKKHAQKCLRGRHREVGRKSKARVCVCMWVREKSAKRFFSVSICVCFVCFFLRIFFPTSFYLILAIARKISHTRLKTA